MVSLVWSSSGGKWICGVDVLRSRKCLVYSYGVNKDLSFELELIGRTGCEVREHTWLKHHENMGRCLTATYM